MAELSLYRGEKSKVKNFPLKDGQVLIGTISDKTAAIYIDTLNKAKELIRVEIDLSEYIEKIESLETMQDIQVTGVKGNAETAYRKGEVNLTPANIGAIPLSGSNAIIGNLTITNKTANTNTQFVATRTDTGANVWCGVGTGGVNHGVYSGTLDKWIVYADASNVYLNGNASTASKLGTATVGGTTKPIYLNAGTPTAFSSTVGGTAKPIYMNAGTLTACSSTVGSATKPTYLNAGTVTACTYSLEKSVPSDAVFTDTTYSSMTGASTTATGKAGLVPAPAAGAATRYLRSDGTWATPPNTTYSAATTSAAGLMSAADKTTINGLANTYAKKSIYNDTAVSMGRESGSTVGNRSFAFGNGVTASGSVSHAEGSSTTASGDYSHAEGIYTTASGAYSHAEGSYATASSSTCHAEGAYTTASGADSHAEGNTTTASNACSHASGHRNAAMTTGGTITNTTGHAFVIGNGTSSTALKNAFSVMFSGVVKAASTITASTTADYAEFFEWMDGNPDNEDRVGKFVTLDGDKIRFANENDEYILGIVSGEPFVLGNGDCDTWNGMVMRDEFGRTIYEPAPKMATEEVTEEIEREVEEPDETTGEITTKTVKETVVTGFVEKEVYDEYGNLVYEGERPVINPNYNPDEAYVSRFDRNEWSPIGMLGVLSVYDDGTCEVNGYCRCNNDAIATKSDTGYRVIERITKNIVRVVFR